jgi:hypothetical protein
MRAIVSNTGRDELLRRFDRLALAGRMTAIVGALATTGTVWRARQKAFVAKGRTAGENVIALRSQAKYFNRNPLWMSRDDKIPGQEMWQRAVTHAIIHGMIGRDMIEAANGVAIYFVRTVQRHIERNIGKGGAPMQPVTDGVQKQKEREMPGTPKSELTPLRWTGQLMKSLIPYARRG